MTFIIVHHCQVQNSFAIHTKMVCLIFNEKRYTNYITILKSEELMRNYTQQYINGEWIDSDSNETIEVINPATEEVIGKVAKGNSNDVEKQ